MKRINEIAIKYMAEQEKDNLINRLSVLCSRDQELLNALIEGVVIDIKVKDKNLLADFLNIKPENLCDLSEIEFTIERVNVIRMKYYAFLDRYAKDEKETRHYETYDSYSEEHPYLVRVKKECSRNLYTDWDNDKIFEIKIL